VAILALVLAHELIDRAQSVYVPLGFCIYRVEYSKWNMLDNDSVTAKTVNGFKTKPNWNENGQRRWVCFLD